MLDDPEAGFPAVLEELLPRLRNFAGALHGPGAETDALVQSAVAVAASRHLLAAAARADALAAMPQAVAGVLGTWLDQAPAVPEQVGPAVRELREALTEAALRARAEGQAGAAAALLAAASELESGHGWLWLPPTLPAPAHTGPEAVAGSQPPPS